MTSRVSCEMSEYVELKNSLGKAVPMPKRSFAGEVPVDTWKVFLQPSNTIGSALTQSPFIERQRRDVLSERWNLSIIPFV